MVIMPTWLPPSSNAETVVSRRQRIADLASVAFAASAISRTLGRPEYS
jgi:hypothetical protein